MSTEGPPVPQPPQTEVTADIVARLNATEEEALHFAESQIGVPIYRVSEEHERSNIRGYSASDDSPRTLQRKINLAHFIPSGCWRRIVEKEGNVGYAAVVYGPNTGYPITVRVAKVHGYRQDSLVIAIYGTPLRRITELGNEVEITSDITDYVTLEDYKKMVPEINKEVERNKGIYGDTNAVAVSDIVNKPMLEARAARNLTDLFETVEAECSKRDVNPLKPPEK